MGATVKIDRSERIDRYAGVYVVAHIGQSAYLGPAGQCVYTVADAKAHPSREAAAVALSRSGMAVVYEVREMIHDRLDGVVFDPSPPEADESE